MITMVLVVLGMHVVTIVLSQEKVNSTYSIDEECDVLVMGSSDAGCSIVEGKEFHNKVAWTSMTTLPSILIRLREFERRNQLNHVKTLIVPFSVKSLSIYTDVVLSERYYSEFPMSWRYYGDYPGSVMGLVKYAATHLRFPMRFALSFESVPVRKSLVDRSVKERQEYFDKATGLSKNMILDGVLINGWEDSVKTSISEIHHICRKYNIRLVFYQAPFYDVFRKSVPIASVEKEREIVNWMRQVGIEYAEDFCKLDEKDYYDWVHLTSEGAIKFTRCMYKALNIPIAFRQCGLRHD